MKTSKEQRKQLERDNRRFPLSLLPLPREDWAHIAKYNQIEVWRSRHFLVQIFQQRDNIIRLTVCRTAHSGAGKVPGSLKSAQNAISGYGDSLTCRRNAPTPGL